MKEKGGMNFGHNDYLKPMHQACAGRQPNSYAQGRGTNPQS